MMRVISFTLVSGLDNFSTPKMELIYSSETPVDFHRTTQGMSPEVTALHNNCCENLISHNLDSVVGARSFEGEKKSKPRDLKRIGRET
jgi:hypothetical protein